MLPSSPCSLPPVPRAFPSLGRHLPAIAGCLCALAGTMALAQDPVRTILYNPTEHTYVLRLMAPIEGDSSVKVNIMHLEPSKNGPIKPAAVATGGPAFAYLDFKVVLPPWHQAMIIGDRGSQTYPLFMVNFTLEREEVPGVANPVIRDFRYMAFSQWSPQNPAQVCLEGTRISPKAPYHLESITALGGAAGVGEAVIRAIPGPAAEERKAPPAAAAPAAAAGADLPA